MSPAAEIQLIVFRELRRSVRSIKGIVLGILTLIGAFVTSLICTWVEGNDRADAGALSTSAYTEMKRQAILSKTGNEALANHYSTLPSSLLLFLQVTIWLGPLLIALLGFDQMAGELQHRSVRFWTVRSRRWSFFAGKLGGLWLLIGIITLVLNVLAGTVAAIRGYVSAGQLFTWGIWFWFIAFIIAGAWAALATFISSCFRTPILALLTTFGTFFILWLFGIVGMVSRMKELAETHVMPSMTWYEYIYPNAYDALLLDDQKTRVLTGLGILIGFVGVVVAGGSFLFARRDI